MKKYLVKVFAIIIVILASSNVKAQFSGTGSAPGTQGSGVGIPQAGGTKTPVVPFDGGMSLMLLASGVGYASKQLKKKKN